jgi:hypothetical protein
LPGSDGFIGLASGLSGASGKSSYLQYLKKIGAITQNTFSLEFDAENFQKNKVSQATLTFGKYNASLDKSSLELVESNNGKKSYMIKSLGFSFNNSYYNFPGKSYLRLDPFQNENGYFTQDEARFTATKTAFENIWKEITNNDIHKISWEETKNADVTIA